MRISTPIFSSNASPTPRRSFIPSRRTRRSLRFSRPSALTCRAIGGHSTASMRRVSRYRRRASCASTTTSTRWPRRPLAARSTCMPYADRIVIKQDGIVVGEHARRFGRDQIAYDPWHYVPVLARKPGALRNGAPFKDWPLPASLEQVRARLSGSDDGDRQMVKVLTAVLTDGLQAVEAACAEALAAGIA